MIPSEEQARALWDTYNLPEKKRLHVTLVMQVALYLAQECQKQVPGMIIDMSLLRASALLHDIDKSIPKLPGESHPDTGVRILKEEGMTEVADVVKTHSLHAIVDPAIAPTTWEEKLLYLADKMVKFSIITVDERFALWRAEKLPPEAVRMLDITYPLVKSLESEIMTLIHHKPEDIAKLA